MPAQLDVVRYRNTEQAGQSPGDGGYAEAHGCDWVVGVELPVDSSTEGVGEESSGRDTAVSRVRFQA